MATAAEVPYMIDPDLALKLVLENAQPLPAAPLSPDDAAGCLLAEDIAADRDYPPFHRAMMDGVAVRVSDAGKTVEVTGEVAAGRAPSVAVSEGCCVDIMTGAACPEGAEAVVPVESIKREGGRVTLPASITPGRHIAPQGSDCAAGTVILRAGEVLTPVTVGVLASVGHQPVRAVPRPVVAVIATGAELVASGDTPAPWQIRDSNGPLLRLCAIRAGLTAVHQDRAGDSLEALGAALDRAADADVIVLSGGVSVGKYDFVPEALKRFGAETVFYKVTQKPGKPLLFCRKGPQLFFGLPGNPLSAHMCFHRYVEPALRCLAGLSAEAAEFTGTLAEPVTHKGGRTRFLLARAECKDGSIRVTPRGGMSSADIFNSNGANCYVRIPGGAGGMAAGESVQGQWMGERRWAQ